LLSDVLVAGIDISDMLDTLNKRITVLLDREHTIGHSYLLPLKDAPTIENLAGIFENKIIPLLQEYFHDDYEKIRLVLGDNQKTDAKTCFIVKKTDVMKLFRSADIDVPEYYYEINSEALMRIDAYAYL
jgi:5-methylcytosine-specific restriction protein B